MWASLKQGLSQNMKYLLSGIVVAIFILSILASKNNDKRDALAAAKAQQSVQRALPEHESKIKPTQDVGATSYVHSLQRAEQSAKDVAKTQDEYMQKMQQAEQ